MVMRVAARLRDGSIQHYDVSNIADPLVARAFVLENVPSARVIMALVEGGKGKPVVTEGKAA